MTVISEVNGVECDEREYPWLGDCAGLIVLFCANGVGTVLDGDDVCVGQHSDDWDMDMFEPFAGRVTLSNDDVEIVELED